nr:MAG TPA: hypothetical protein [Caudoviricetes sp.]
MTCHSKPVNTLPKVFQRGNKSTYKQLDLLPR